MVTHKLRYRVLIIGDDNDALIVRDTLDALSESESDTVYSVEYTERLQIGLERLANEKFDIILLDLNLPDSIGLNTLEKLQDKVSEVPVIVFTDLNDESIGISAVNMGAQDYLVKGVIPDKFLIRSIRYAIERHHLLIEQRRADEALRISAQQWQTTFDAMNDAVCLMDTERRIIRANNAMSNFLGKPASEIVGKFCYELVHGTSAPPEECPIFQMRKTHLRENHIFTINDRYFGVNVDPLIDGTGNITGAVHVMYDITEQKLLEEMQNISYRFLKLANQHTEIIPLLNEFVKEIHEFTTCEAIGIRILDENGNIPYIAYKGFSHEFYESESPLSIHSDHCMCINVIKGEIDPKLPYFTESGSFYMNGTTKFLATVSEEDKGQTRNECNRAGYESVALIPISISDRIIGLIHVADHQENKIPLKMVNVLERLANELGTAIQRVKMEEFILNSEKQYRIINENMRDAVWLMDMQMRTTWISPSVEKLRGYTLQELAEMPLDKHLTPESLQKAIAIISEYITPENLADKNKDITITVDLEFYKKDGATFWGDTVISLLRDNEGNPSMFLCVGRDITERKGMEKSLIESEKKYRELVENLNDIIFNIDVKGYITYISPAVNQILGYTVDEVMGKHINQYIAIQNLPGLMSVFEQTMKGELHPYEFQMVAKDGTIHYVRASSRPILENIEVIGLTVLLTDITTQRQLEEQFRQAQKMEAVGLLAGGIAHDFNNLLQIITGYSEILLRKLDESNPMRSFIEEIRKAGEQSTVLTRQLLAFSNKQVLQQQVLSINDLISNIGKMLKRIIGEDIELVVSLAPETILLKIDPGQIEQIIMNLVVNARDAMSSGGKLTIKTESAIIDYYDNYSPLLIPESRPGDYVRLSISDTGIGMSKDIVSHIFEPFFSTKGSMGTGLGLAVVYGVVKQHNGWINVYSEPNKGSVFKIYLPKFPKKSETEDQKEPKLMDFHGNGERILLVEDERQVREFVVSLVQENGYLAFVASSAAEAMEVFMEESGNFHLIFTDVVLSDENGIQLVEKLLAINPNISVLLTSGYTNQKSQWNTIKDKGFRFIQKPYTVIDLLKALKETIKEVSCII